MVLFLGWDHQEMRADMSGTSQKTAVSSGRSPCAPRKGLPMSERQQLALVMQMCASDKSAAAAGSGASGVGTSASSSATSASGASSSGHAAAGTTGTGSPPAAGLSPSGSGGGASSSTAGGSASRSSRSSRNERGETPLHLAAIRGDVALTRRLLSRGADPNCVDFAGE
ncbi:hypothetical protein B566_EDAN006944 [Ephemera danica]|nr:hypothetical protein B566_EDAN006944 [Ephemera danica]